MSDIPVLYSTTEGQTRRIAERIASHLRQRGFTSEALSVDTVRAGVPWSEATQAVILGASLHGGRHQRAAVDFVTRYRDHLNGLPSAFFSVSLAAASRRPGEAAEARRLADTFAAQAGWRPFLIATIAGRLAYTQYGVLKRWFMRAIAKREGGSTDTTRDHEYTDWPAVDRFADAVADRVRAQQPARSLA